MTVAGVTFAVKRGFDIALSLAILPVAVPLIGLAALAIRREDGGPAMFAQRRIGRAEREFTLYKLRTMRIGTLDLPSHETSHSVITRAGRLLRRTKLDELPQLWNVLKGEMSLVGPRPCLPSQTELIAERRRLGVFSVRPGITGLGQVEGLTMDRPVELATRDQAYVDDLSLLRDIRIIWRTLTGAGSGDAVRR